jgi:inward rectifier potassium channel
MKRRPRKEIFRTRGYDVHIVGGRPVGLRDLYHGLLRVPWWAVLLVIVGGYLGVATLFAGLYVWSGGVANARPGSFWDAFFFAVQTGSTVGYGTMYPVSRLANALVVAQSIIGLIATALATGLVFVRFSMTRPRVVFSARAAITPMDGVPTLMVRVGNERRNQIVATTFRLTLTRSTRTQEGMTIYRSFDLPLVRDRAGALQRSWMVLHRIDAHSPLAGDTPESLARDEVEVTLEVLGTDDTSLQPVFARHAWFASEILFGARLADVLTELPDGNIQLDLRRFHELEPTEPTDAFPYRHGM